MGGPCSGWQGWLPALDCAFHWIFRPPSSLPSPLRPSTMTVGLQSCDRGRAGYPTSFPAQLCRGCLLQKTVAGRHAVAVRTAHTGTLRQPATLPAPPPTSALNTTPDQRSTLVPHWRSTTACATGRQPCATPGEPGLHGATSEPRCATQKSPFPAPPPLPLAPLPLRGARGYPDDEGVSPVAPLGHANMSQCRGLWRWSLRQLLRTYPRGGRVGRAPTLEMRWRLAGARD